VLNFNHLYYFHVVADEGTIAGAATRLGVTQPTVSEQVRSLERALGVTLFERQPSGLRLTDAGRRAFDQTIVMFRAGERLVEGLGLGTRPGTRTLRIGLSTGVGRATTAEFLLPLLALDDAVPELVTLDLVELVREVRGGTLDLGLVESELTAAACRGLIATEIDAIDLVAIAPPDLAPSATWGDAGLVQYRATSPYRGDVDAYLAEHGLDPRVVAEADDPGFVLEAALRGRYVAFVPRSIARDALAAGRAKILAHLEDPAVRVHALHADGVDDALARRAVEALIERARTLRG
jgi:LysR family transcriptional activator of nhaA